MGALKDVIYDLASLPGHKKSEVGLLLTF